MLLLMRKIINSSGPAAIIILLVAVLCGVQSFLLDAGNTGNAYTHYNNYVIFKNSFFNLVQQKDLYQLYPQLQWDLYKYSPTFALFFGLLAWLPNIVGLILWNLLNAGVLVWAIRALPALSDKKKAFILLYVLVELVGSLQNSQSNALMAGLMIGAFAMAEKQRFIFALALVICSVYIKLFGLAGFAIFIFYPKKLKNAIACVVITAVFFILPLAVVPFKQLLFLYKSWGGLLKQDNDASLGLSIFGWLQTWFNLAVPRVWVLAAGLLVYFIPFTRLSLYKNIAFRYCILASTLLWVIVFNHKSESPTFIIAVAGVAIWFCNSKRRLVDVALLVAVFIFTMLSPTDIFPHFVKDRFFIPYVVKAVPCIVVWFVISYRLIVSPKTYLPAN